MAACQIEDPWLRHVRPYLMVYRHSASGWICVEFGEKSAYVKWFGRDYAQSSIGRPIVGLPAGKEFGRMLDQSFHDVEVSQAARLDHVFTRMPNQQGDSKETMVYQRLMMAGFFPDRSPAVLSLVVPTINVNIRGINEEERVNMMDIDPPDFGLKDARFEGISGQ